MKEGFKKKLIEVLSLALLLAGANVSLRYGLVEHTYADDYLKDLKTLEAHSSDIEMVFLGSSRTFHGFAPYVFDEILEGEALNAGSALQSTWGSYYALKDLLDRGFEPEYAILGISYDLLTADLSTQADLIVMDRLSVRNKIEYLANAYEAENKLYALSKIYRYRTNFTRERIKNNVSEKGQRKAAAASGQPFVKEGEFYDGRGFVYSNNRFSDAAAAGSIGETQITEWREAEIKQGRLDGLNALVRLCADKGIELFFVDTPTTEYMLKQASTYDAANAWWEDYCVSNGIEYLNYNYIEKKDELFPDELFMDYNHLNGVGAEVFSRLCAEDIRRFIR